VLAGAVLAFAKSLGEFGATITFVSNIPGETQTIPTAIYSYIQTPNGDWAALRLTMMAIALSVLALVVSQEPCDQIPHLCPLLHSTPHSCERRCPVLGEAAGDNAGIDRNLLVRS